MPTSDVPPEKTEAFLKMLRRQGVSAFEGFGLRVRLGPQPAGVRKVAETANMRINDADDGDDLFYSAGG